MDKYLEMPDGRKINETTRQQIVKEISKLGVCGHHLTMLCHVFDAKENECQVALNITKVTWNRLSKTIGEINDPSLAMLISWFLAHPEEWPVKFRGEPDVNEIERFFGGNTNLSMLAGRSTHAIYRWRSRLPTDHIRLILLIMQEAIVKIKNRNNDPVTSAEGEARLNEFIDIAEAEASRRSVNIRKDRSWGSKE